MAWSIGDVGRLKSWSELGESQQREWLNSSASYAKFEGPCKITRITERNLYFSQMINGEERNRGCLSPFYFVKEEQIIL